MILIVVFVNFLLFALSALNRQISSKMSRLRNFNSARLSCTVSKFDAYFNELSLKREANLKETSYSIEMIKNLLDKRKLNLAPDYQREFVWKEGRSARLIETILNKRFIPAVVWHEKSDGTFDVIDGKQRLSTILSFYCGKKGVEKYGLPESACILKPDSTDEGEEHPLMGLTFDALSDSQMRNFENFEIYVKKVPANADAELIFDIYEDINSGADDLTSQQLRRAAFNGPYMTMIKGLRENKDFLAIRGSAEVDMKESDGEMILRAFSFSNINYLDFKPPLKKFLNRDCASNQYATEEQLSKWKDEFESIVAIMIVIFDRDAVCREWDSTAGKWKSKPAPWLWDSLYVSIKQLLNLDRKKYNAVFFQKNADRIKGAFQVAFDKPATKAAFHSRVQLMTRLLLSADGMADTKSSAPGLRRLFPRDRETIAALWQRQDRMCPLCRQSIHESRMFDQGYTHIDHIRPHSKGGLTVDSNSQLVHKSCNRE
jgi:hypothetical protein